MEVIVGMFRVLAVALTLTILTLMLTYLQSAATSLGLDMVQLVIQLAHDTLSATPDSS